MSSHNYRLKISLIEPHYPISVLHRILDVQGDCTFYELHQAMVEYFDHQDENLWQFFISRQKMDGFGKLQECPEHVLLPNHVLWQDHQNLTLHLPNITLNSLHLNEKDYLYYGFDIGDGWLYRIRIEKISQSDTAQKITLIKKVGELPKMPDKNNSINPPQNDVDGEFELLLVSALMMIAIGGDGEPVRWQELVDNGVADELVKRKLIKPCVSPTHKVRLTPFGESELVRFMEMANISK